MAIRRLSCPLPRLGSYINIAVAFNPKPSNCGGVPQRKLVRRGWPLIGWRDCRATMPLLQLHRRCRDHVLLLLLPLVHVKHSMNYLFRLIGCILAS
jgi:hypothetical protein